MKIKSVKNDVAGGYNVVADEVIVDDVVLDFRTLSVPNDPANRDYGAVQRWIAAGNTPDAADAPPMAPTLTQAITDRRATDPVLDDLFKRTEALEAV